MVTGVPRKLYSANTGICGSLYIKPLAKERMGGFVVSSIARCLSAETERQPDEPMGAGGSQQVGREQAAHSPSWTWHRCFRRGGCSWKMEISNATSRLPSPRGLARPRPARHVIPALLISVTGPRLHSTTNLLLSIPAFAGYAPLSSLELRVPRAGELRLRFAVCPVPSR